MTFNYFNKQQSKSRYPTPSLADRVLPCSRPLPSGLTTGFIALVSVILISFVLITFAVSISLSGYLGRFNQLEGEFKEQSVASAEACVEKAIADLVAENTATGTVTFGSGAYSCTIVSIASDTPTTGETTIKAQGIHKNSYTNLVVVVDSTTQAVLSWREYATMP